MKKTSLTIFVFGALIVFADRFAHGQVIFYETLAGVGGATMESAPDGSPMKLAMVKKRLEAIGYTNIGEISRESPDAPYTATATDRNGQEGVLMIEPITGTVISFMPK